MHSEVLKHCI